MIVAVTNLVGPRKANISIHRSVDHSTITIILATCHPTILCIVMLLTLVSMQYGVDLLFLDSESCGTLHWCSLRMQMHLKWTFPKTPHEHKAMVVGTAIFLNSVGRAMAIMAALLF